MVTRRLVIAALGILAGAAALSAAMPSFWQVSTQAEFLKGTVEHLSIDSHGRLLLGPTSTSLYEATAPFLWTAVAAPDGTIYVGSGNEGQVLRIDPAGKSSVFFDADELEVHALALAPGGGLYVGTSPDGKIYKVDAGGKSTVLFDPPDRYIWSLAVDKAGSVFAATGDKGVVYKISPNGTAAPFYSTKATHAIALAFDREGRLLVGTESPGRIFQIDAAGKPFVILESPFNEIHAIRVTGDGTIFATAIGGRAPGGGDRTPARPVSEPSPPAMSVPSVSAEITSITIAADVTVTPSGGSAAPRPPSGTGAGGLYRIAPDGAWDLVWESREDVPYDVAVEPDGSLLVVTGNKGKIFRLAGDPLESTLVARAEAQQVTTVFRDRSGAMVYSTSNPGRLLRLSTARADKGAYESDVRDAQTTASWGTLRWHATTPPGARLEVVTRSGNTKTPDETWSPWSAPYATAEGTPIVSPQARYLQWKAIFTGGRGESPLLTSVTAAYLQRNLRPRVTSITIHPPGTVFQRPYPTGDPDIAGYDLDPPDRRALTQSSSGGSAQASGPALGRKAYQKGLMTFVWRADDENADELQYDVLYRREGETTWKTLRQTLKDEILVWDTTSVPNGTYVLRVVASDAPSNPAAATLTGHLDSDTFDIDNTPPVIVIGAVRRDGARTVVPFDVRDDQSVVQKVEYSLDGTSWKPVYPTDGIADSRAEHFELLLDGEAAIRGVMIRATDALNNMGGASSQNPAVTKP